MKRALAVGTHQRRHLLGALGPCQRAAQPVGASLGSDRGCRGLRGGVLRPLLRVQPRGGRQQRQRVGVLGRGEQSRRRRALEIRPACMTQIRLQSARTTCRLWVTKTSVRSCSPASRASRFTITACTDTSSAEVTSSARTTVGSTASARAMATRCRWPPESFDGRTEAATAGSPTVASSSRTCCSGSPPWRPPASTASASTFPIRSLGLSECTGPGRRSGSPGAARATASPGASRPGTAPRPTTACRPPPGSCRASTCPTPIRPRCRVAHPQTR